jgi:hypothetical protein
LAPARIPAFHLLALHSSGVADSDGRPTGRGRGEDLAVLLNVDDGRTARANRTAGVLRGRRASEGDSAEVSEGDEAATGAEVLNDPFSVLFAQRGGGGDRLSDSRPLRVVLDYGRAGLGRRRGHSDRD